MRGGTGCAATCSATTLFTSSSPPSSDMKNVIEPTQCTIQCRPSAPVSSMIVRDAAG